MALLKWGPSSGYPGPCLSGRGPLTDRRSPGTGRVIFLKTSMLIGLACPVEGSLSDGVARRQRTAFSWPLWTAPSFIARSQEADRRWKGPNRLSVDLNTQQLSLSNEGEWKEKVWIAPNPASCLATFHCLKSRTTDAKRKCVDTQGVKAPTSSQHSVKRKRKEGLFPVFLLWHCRNFMGLWHQTSLQRLSKHQLFSNLFQVFVCSNADLYCFHFNRNLKVHDFYFKLPLKYVSFFYSQKNQISESAPCLKYSCLFKGHRRNTQLCSDWTAQRRLSRHD